MLFVDYYKLLADFSLYDSKGNYAPHQKVEYNMPDQVPYLDENGHKRWIKSETYIRCELEKELKVRDDIAAKLADKSEAGLIPRFIKAVNGRENIEKYAQLTPNILQAVPDTKAKTLFIVSAFIGEQGYTGQNRKGTSQLNDATAPPRTPENDFVIVPNYSVPQKNDLSTPSDKNISDDSQLSYTPTKAERIAALVDQYEGGLITREQFEEQLIGKNKDDPISIARNKEKITEEDAMIPFRSTRQLPTRKH